MTRLALTLPIIASLQKEELGFLTEFDFQAAVIGYLEAEGFMVEHRTRSASRGRNGGFYSTGPKGYPDLTIAGYGQTWLRELKKEGHYPEPEQKAWLAASGGEVWRPRDAGRIIEFVRAVKKRERIAELLASNEMLTIEQ